MKILYVAAEASNFVINLCNEFCNQGHKVTCIIQDVDSYDDQNPIKEVAGLRTFKIPFATFFNDVRLERIVSTHLTEGNYDIVFCSHSVIFPAVITAAKLRDINVPCGAMLLDIPTDLMKQEPVRMKNWEYWFKYLKLADLIITNTDIAAEEYERYTGTKLPKENVVTYGINQPVMFNKKGLDKHGDTVVSICRLTDLKNCILIPKALGKLNLNLKYVAIGRNSGQLDLIDDYCKKYGIEFEHYQNVTEYRKFRFLEDCSMLIYPQKSEYIGGLSPFEAMFVGKPSLVPDVRVLKDLYGEHAFYFKNDDADSLAELIKKVHTQNRGGLKEKLIAASDYSQSEASFENMAKKMLKLMESMLK